MRQAPLTDDERAIYEWQTWVEGFGERGQQALKVVYQVTDGGALDLDGSANGTIVDPAGPARLATGTPDTGVPPVGELLGIKVKRAY